MPGRTCAFPSASASPRSIAPRTSWPRAGGGRDACKAAKDRGRNRVEVYQQSDASIVRRYADIGMAGKLREAIEEGRLHLDAQLILPFSSADSGRPHYELLLRMTDEADAPWGRTASCRPRTATS